MGFCPSGLLSQWAFVLVGFCPSGPVSCTQICHPGQNISCDVFSKVASLMGCFIQGGRNGSATGCFVQGGRNGIGCFIQGGRNGIGCFIQGGKSERDVLPRVGLKWHGMF